MAESIQKQMDTLQQAIKNLEQAVPLIVTPSRKDEGLQFVIQAADIIGELGLDEDFSSLSTNMKIITNSESTVLDNIAYQAFILDVLEMLTALLNKMKNEGRPKETDAAKMDTIAKYLIRLSGRVTNRYKLKVIFEKEYEAKQLRAFMVLNELSSVVRFLNVSPDISENQDANLENGLEVDILSQSSPDELHKLAGSVLEVQNVQIFTETRPQPVMMLDPPENPNSFDKKITEFLSN